MDLFNKKAHGAHPLLFGGCILLLHFLQESFHFGQTINGPLYCSLRQFGKDLNQKDTIGLFFFAGHGLQIKNRNYLVPIGANVESESEIEFETIDAGRILGQMDDAQKELNLMILDACRNNPFERSWSRLRY